MASICICGEKDNYIPNILHTKSTKKRRVVKPHLLKWKGRGCVLSVIQAGFPFGEREGRMGGQEKRRKRRRREEKIKQLETGDKKKKEECLNGEHVSGCEYPDRDLKGDTSFVLWTTDTSESVDEWWWRIMMAGWWYLLVRVFMRVHIKKRRVAHISRTVLSCSSLDFFSSISQSLCWPSSTSSRRAISSTSWKHRGFNP